MQSGKTVTVFEGLHTTGEAKTAVASMGMLSRNTSLLSLEMHLRKCRQHTHVCLHSPSEMHSCDWIMVRSVAQEFMGLRHCCILKVIFYYFWNNEKELASKNSQYFKHCSILRSTEVTGVYRFLRVDMACTSYFPPVIQAHDHQSRWAQNQSTHWDTSGWKLKLHVLKQTAHSLQYMVNHKNLITEIFFWNMQWRDLRVCAQRAEDRLPYKCQNNFHK